MPLAIDIDGIALPTDPAALKDLKSDKDLAFQLAAALKPYLDAPLSLVPDTVGGKLAYTSPSAAWNPADSAVKFGLSGGAAGALDVVKTGNLLTYTDGLDSPKDVAVPVPAGHVYVRLTLQFQIAASVAAKGSFSGGMYGVTASADTQDTYAITFCKAFLPTTVLRDAVKQSFESFVFPFTEHILDALHDGDYLVHDFDGKLNLAVGAYAGLDKVLYAGQGSADVLRGFQNPTVKLSASVKPEVKLAASMDFKMAYEARFQAMLNKVGKTVRLHLFKSSTLSQNVTVAAGLTVSLNAKADVKEMVSDHLPELTSTLVNAAGGAGSVGGAAVTKLMGAVPTGELQKYVDEATDKLTSWLNKANGQKCNLQVALESTRKGTLLLSCTFDLGVGDIAAGWKCAIEGDLFGALNTHAVTLDVGSGLEKDYRSKTSFQCNVFNLWHFATWEEFHSNVKLVYAGNNVFHIQATVGRTTETSYVGALRDMDIYFTASADADAAGNISNSDFTLNVAMNAAGRDSINTLSNLLGAVDRSARVIALVRDMRAFATKTRQGSAHLLFKIPGTSFAQFHADAKSGYADSSNWAVFARSASDLNAWPLTQMGSLTSQFGLDTYEGWKTLNMALTGAAAPDRNQLGSPGIWPGDWALISDTGTRARIRYSMLAAQQYLNFCAALQSLSEMQVTTNVTTPWEAMLTLITEAIQDDLNVDFLRPAALATVRQCMGSTYVLTGPAPATIPTDHFAVSIDLL